jgi:hypothetical protein
MWGNGWKPASYNLIDMLILDVWAYFILWALFGIIDWRESQHLNFHSGSYEDYRHRRDKDYDRKVKDINEKYDQKKRFAEVAEKSQVRSDKNFADRVKRDIIGTKEADIIEVVAEVIENPRIRTAIKKQLSKSKKKPIVKRRRLK